MRASKVGAAVAFCVFGMAAGMFAAAGDYVELDAAKFQRVINGKKTDLYTITNKNGMIVKICNLGARIMQIIVPDATGKMGDVAEGYDNIDSIIKANNNMGAFVGRFANRIA